jgi:hypothetical protein
MENALRATVHQVDPQLPRLAITYPVVLSRNSRLTVG